MTELLDLDAIERRFASRTDDVLPVIAALREALRTIETRDRQLIAWESKYNRAWSDMRRIVELGPEAERDEALARIAAALAIPPSAAGRSAETQNDSYIWATLGDTIANRMRDTFRRALGAES